MTGFDRILLNTLKNEGGETTDTGGHTNYGVTQKTYDAVSPQLGLPKKNVKDLKYGEVRKVYEQEFYKNPKIDSLPSEKVQGIVFDHAVNAGPGTAVKTLQTIVGSSPDGVMGKKTAKAVQAYIEKYGEDILANELLVKRAEEYGNLAGSNPQKYGMYFNGWMNRLQNLKQQYKLSTA